MSLFKLKRAAYLRIKGLVNRFPLLKKINATRRRIKGRRLRKAVSKHSLETAARVVEALESEGFRVVMAFGSLLGPVRDGHFISYDNDLDFGIEVDSQDEWKRIRSALESAGFEITRQFDQDGVITEQSYRSNGFDFDIFGFMPVEGSTDRRSFYYCILDEGDYETPDDRSVKYIDLPAIDEVVYIDVDGVSLPIPGNAEECLTRAYTNHWRVPDPTWVSGTEGGWRTMKGKVVRRTVFKA